MSNDWAGRIRLLNPNFLLSLAQNQNLSHSAAVLHAMPPGLSKWLKVLSCIRVTIRNVEDAGLIPRRCNGIYIYIIII